MRSYAFSSPLRALQDGGDNAGATKMVESFAVVEPNLKSLASRFSGKWRGINDEVGDKALATEEWFKKPNSVGTRIAPKDWGFEGSMAPLIHEVHVYFQLVNPCQNHK